MVVKKWDYPPYEAAFDLSHAYDFGWGLMSGLRDNMEGGPGCSNEDAGLLAEVIWRAGHSDHLELGTLFGATAILAALMKQKFEFEGSVFCVDNFSYLKDEYDSGEDLVRRNARVHGVDYRLKIFEANTWPLPVDVYNHVKRTKNFGSAYIDAAHDSKSCKKDWESVKGISNTVVFHDYDRMHGGVVNTVRTAMQDPEWWLVHLSEHTAIFERVE